MTKEQAEQFLKDVTGRKIRKDYWGKDDYLIPTGKWYDKTYANPYWWLFECIKPNNKKTWFLIREGFSKDEWGESWEYVEDFETYLELLDL